MRALGLTLSLLLICSCGDSAESSLDAPTITISDNGILVSNNDNSNVLITPADSKVADMVVDAETVCCPLFAGLADDDCLRERFPGLPDDLCRKEETEIEVAEVEARLQTDY